MATRADKPSARALRASSLLPEGRLVAGRYIVERVLGEGATGIVYLARPVGPPSIAIPPSPPSPEHVALKVIHRHLSGDTQVSRRFHREAKILRRLEGAHLVRLLDFVEDDGLLAIALDHVDGAPLEERLGGGPIDVDEAIEVTLQVCAALEAAHAAGVVHRDLKPGNVMIERPAPEGPPLTVRVVDFGLAKVVHGEAMTTGLTEHDMIFGTPEYMAPEQARGDEVDARSDVYAAGVMLYEMVVGRPPFTGRMPLAIMTAHMLEAPTAPRAARPDGGISAALEVAILRALSKDRDDRFPSAGAFAEALRAARAPEGPSLGSADTDLALARTDLAHAKTLNADAATSSVRPPERRGEPAPPSARLAPSSPLGRFLWAFVALVAALTAVAAGVLFGR